MVVLAVESDEVVFSSRTDPDENGRMTLLP
jgi:hypothetical protein